MTARTLSSNFPVTWDCQFHRNIPFEELERLRLDALQRVRKDPSLRVLLFSEPKSAFTFGKSARGEDLLWDRTRLDSEKVSVFPVDRGGEWTYHGPGQVVLYPTLNLNSLGLSDRAVRPFLTRFQEELVRFLSEGSIPVKARENPVGLFTEDGKKVGSFGFSISRGLVSHGVALYLEPQAHYFQGIHPCGTPNQPMGSLREAGETREWEHFSANLAQFLKNSLSTNWKLG